MNIFVDESGSFVESKNPESWNAVAAVATAESARLTISRSLMQLRRAVGAKPNEEVKLNRVGESNLVHFLASLHHPGIVAFAVATDACQNTLTGVREHQSHLVASTRAQIPLMLFDGGKMGLTVLANRIESLSPQLYVQLICQVGLFQDVISRSINYFVQRQPKTLREFRWRIDQKNSEKPTFEETFLKVAPPLLQTRSIADPIWTIRQFDYSSMKAYQFEEGKTPDYLQRDHGFPEIEGFDLQKLLRGNLQFVDSRSSDGVQVADLLASTLRRVLRKNFDRCGEIAEALAPILLANQRGRHPILLSGFTGEDVDVNAHVASMVRIFERKCKALLLRNPRSDA